jgi:EpsI family protein
LFVAYFKSMQNSEGPHSPRVCLPSAGWLVRSSEILPLPVPGPSGTIPVNRYVMERSGDRILVVYWYQDTHDAWAEEFQAKLKLLNNLIRYRRSDVSLIRIITPVNRTTAGNEFATCVGFTRQMYPALVERFNATR